MDLSKLSKVADNLKTRSNIKLKLKDSTSPQMDELIEACESMPDGEDEIIVETTSKISQKEIDEFVEAYMRHNPPGEEEFNLTITSLGGNRYKISCPYVGE